MSNFDALIERLTARLRVDPELRMDVANELRAHLEDSFAGRCQPHPRSLTMPFRPSAGNPRASERRPLYRGVRHVTNA